MQTDSARIKGGDGRAEEDRIFDSYMIDII